MTATPDPYGLQGSAPQSLSLGRPDIATFRVMAQRTNFSGYPGRRVSARSAVYLPQAKVHFISAMELDFQRAHSQHV